MSDLIHVLPWSSSGSNKATLNVTSFRDHGLLWIAQVDAGWFAIIGILAQEQVFLGLNVTDEYVDLPWKSPHFCFVMLRNISKLVKLECVNGSEVMA